MKIKTARVRIQRGAKLGSLEVHTNFEISNATAQTFWRPLRDTSEEFLKCLGPIGAQLVRDLMALDGIKYVKIEVYSLGITIAPMFKWEEMREGVYAVLRKAAEATGAQNIKGEDCVHITSYGSDIGPYEF